MIRSWIAPNKKEQIAALQVVQSHGRSPGSDGLLQSNSAGLVAIVGAVVDVVGPISPGKELHEEAGLVRAPAAGIEKTSLGRRGFQSGCNPIKRLIPRDHSVVR